MKYSDEKPAVAYEINAWARPLFWVIVILLALIFI